jgi:broad specificity phosphatase PhoE
MNLILIRHAETEWNRVGRCQGFADVELCDSGKRQVEELAKSLRDKSISAVYSSDLKRAIDTAKAIAGCHKLSVEFDPGPKRDESRGTRRAYIC